MASIYDKLFDKLDELIPFHCNGCDGWLCDDKQRTWRYRRKKEITKIATAILELVTNRKKS